MINIILIILIIHTLGVVLLRPKISTLSCGIFAWAGRSTKQFNKYKFNTLGIYNDSRGGHSCGIAKDGEISVGIDKQKLFRNFIINTGYAKPTIIPAIIGHTRFSTIGTHNIENSHPFGFGVTDGCFKFVGVHNGTLINYRDLAKINNIDIEGTETTNNVEYTRTKIDSEILLECLYTTNDFKVLSEYNGAAALIWQHTEEPNVTYYYHGKSKKIEDDLDSEEERPLYYYKESKNSLYVSSLESSLIAIGAIEKNTGEFEHNTVYKVTDGNIDEAIKTKIDRTKCFQTIGTFYNHNNYYYSGYNKRHNMGFNRNYYPNHDNFEDVDSPPVNKNKQLKLPVSRSNKAELITINQERTLYNLNTYGDKIYFNKLRYWRNGHLITGCYTYIKDIGFYRLGLGLKEANTTFFSIVNTAFIGKERVRNFKALSKEDKKKTFVPFVSTVENEIITPILYYFYNGVRVKTKDDYLACNQMEESNFSFSIQALSLAAAHPITSLSDIPSLVWKDNMPCNEIFCPLESENIYNVKYGKCISISPKRTKRSAGVIKALEKNEADIQKKEKTKVIDITIADDLLDNDLNNIFKDNLAKFPAFIKQLATYKNSKALVAKKILEDFLEKSTKLINFELKE